jgi:hypothetical protein
LPGDQRANRGWLSNRDLLSLIVGNFHQFNILTERRRVCNAEGGEDYK